MKLKTTQTSRPVQRMLLTLTVVLAVSVAAAMPLCATKSCCFSSPAAASIHAQMPCCDEQPTIAPSDTGRAVPSTMTGSLNPPHQWTPVAEVTATDASSNLRVFATLSVVRQALAEPPPPHFLLNAQFLI